MERTIVIISTTDDEVIMGIIHGIVEAVVLPESVLIEKPLLLDGYDGNIALVTPEYGFCPLGLYQAKSVEMPSAPLVDYYEVMVDHYTKNPTNTNLGLPEGQDGKV